MPGIFFEPTNRRNFLKFSTTAGVLALAGCATTSQRSASVKSLHLALLSDTHTPADPANEYRGFKPWENLQRIIPDLAASRPEGAIICGDAARLEGLAGDYAQLRSLLQPLAAQAPIYIAMGNHDDRSNFRAAFPQSSPLHQKVGDRHILLLEHEATNVIILDSLLFVNKVPGLLGNAQRKWLADYLQSHSSQPVVLFVHHTLEDNDGDLLDTPRLFELIRPHPQVKAIFFGHSHVWGIKERAGVKLINLPAVGYNFRDQDPVGWVDAHFNPRGVDLTMRAFAGNTSANGQTTRLQWNA